MPRLKYSTFLGTDAFDVATTDSFFLGRGTFGTVYRGTHSLSGAQAAVKIFHDQTSTDVIHREIEIYKLVQTGFSACKNLCDHPGSQLSKSTIVALLFNVFQRMSAGFRSNWTCVWCRNRNSLSDPTPPLCGGSSIVCVSG